MFLHVQRNKLHTFKREQWAAMAKIEASVMKVPPTFKCSTDCALETCKASSATVIQSSPLIDYSLANQTVFLIQIFACLWAAFVVKNLTLG
jgi:hypothetical protein